MGAQRPHQPGRLPAGSAQRRSLRLDGHMTGAGPARIGPEPCEAVAGAQLHAQMPPTTSQSQMQHEIGPGLRKGLIERRLDLGKAHGQHLQIEIKTKPCETPRMVFAQMIKNGEGWIARRAGKSTEGGDQRKRQKIAPITAPTTARMSKTSQADS